MGGRRGLSFERLEQIYARQREHAWGSSYQPAIRATREEAPRDSRPSILKQVPKLGRDAHLMSQPETSFALLALYHPDVFDLHEQRILEPAPSPHPLQGHPRASGKLFPKVPGTVAVAAELGCLAAHPKVVDPGQAEWVPFPYIGDILLFLDGKCGPYCVAWNIKSSASQFGEDFKSTRLKRSPAKPLARHEVEASYYGAAGIPSHRLSLPDINLQLRANLRHLYGWAVRECRVSEEVRNHVIQIFRDGDGIDRPVYAELQRQSADLGISTHDLKAVFYQAIWRRQLRADLFFPVLIDRPIQQETRDVLDVYAAWFAP